MPTRVALDHVIETARLRLRRMTAADAARVVEIQSNWNVTRNLAAASFPPSNEVTRAWLAGHEAEWTAGRAYRFAIAVDGPLVGCADIDAIAEGQGELGYWLDEPLWGQGLASEAAGALVRFAKEKLGLRRLVAGHAADNPTSGRVLEKLGFRWTGEAVVRSNPRQADIEVRKYALDLAA